MTSDGCSEDVICSYLCQETNARCQSTGAGDYHQSGFWLCIYSQERVTFKVSQKWVFIRTISKKENLLSTDRERLLSFLLNDLSDTEILEACTWSWVLPPLEGCLLSSLWWCFPHHTTHAGIYCDLEDQGVGTSSESSVPRTNEILPLWVCSKHVEITVDTVQWIIERTGKDPYVQWEKSLSSI